MGEGGLTKINRSLWFHTKELSFASQQKNANKICFFAFFVLKDGLVHKCIFLDVLISLLDGSFLEILDGWNPGWIISKNLEMFDILSGCCLDFSIFELVKDLMLPAIVFIWRRLHYLFTEQVHGCIP